MSEVNVKLGIKDILDKIDKVYSVKKAIVSKIHINKRYKNFIIFRIKNF